MGRLQQRLLSQNLLHVVSQDCPLDAGIGWGGFLCRLHSLQQYRLAPLG